MSKKIDKEADARESVQLDPSKTRVLFEAIDRLLLKKKRIEAIEEQLDKERHAHDELSSETIPGLMDELGLDKFVLKDGSMVQVLRQLRASIPLDKTARAFAWLQEHGHGALIKNDVRVQFGAGEDEQAEKLVAIVNKNFDVPADRKQSVHAGTLTAFVKEQLAQGAQVPMELLGVFTWNDTKITQPKKKS